ncbi:Imm61 family immunity protein [Mycolicibacterium nivoides]|uniref:Imm61 family immunity protein n=1 Tax=Mycolicibacterium nivoides TaxID=2487344 RepID=A0ABW9LJC1_9MYCO
MPTTPPPLSDDLRGWARAVGYVCTVDDTTATTLLVPEMPAPTRYHIRWRANARVEVVEASAEEMRPLLFAASTAILETFLFGLFGDDLRESVGLPPLELPWAVDDLAPGYTIAEQLSRGHRVLTRTGVGPIAAAPDPTLSLLTLVPLSHFLGLSVADLKQSFLNEAGRPLMSGRCYASGR